MRILTQGFVDYSAYFYIVQDASATSPGEPVTGLLFSDIQTGGGASYCRRREARKAVTLITQTVTGAHADGGFVEVDATFMPGFYRCDYPDLAFASGADEVTLQLVVAPANNAVASPLKIQLTQVDFQDSVRGGMTALPNAAAEAAGGIFTRGTGVGQINQAANGQVDVNAERLNNIAQSLLDLKDFADAGYDPSTNKVQGVVLVDITTLNTDMRGTDGVDVSAMRGTDGAALATVATEARLAELDSANMPADLDTLLGRVTATLFNGISSLAEWLGLIAGKQTANATARTEIRATGIGSGTFDETTDSNEAIRDTPPLGTSMRGTDGVDTSAMRGTDNASLAAVATEARLAELDQANMPADLDTLLGRVTAALFSGITSLAQWLGLIAGKQVGDATARTEVRATGAGSGAYDETADSQEAIRDTAPLGTTMRGTDDAALASVATEARLAELDPANMPADLDTVITNTIDIISKLPAATVDGLNPTQLWAVVLASCAGRIVDKTVSPMVIQNPDGTQTRISVTTDRGTITLSFTGV